MDPTNLEPPNDPRATLAAAGAVLAMAAAAALYVCSLLLGGCATEAGVTTLEWNLSNKEIGRSWDVLVEKAVHVENHLRVQAAFRMACPYDFFELPEEKEKIRYLAPGAWFNRIVSVPLLYKHDQACTVVWWKAEF